MDALVSINDKKQFVREFLNHLQLKRREAVWILNYIVSNDELLKRVSFVDDSTNLKNVMIMSTHCAEGKAHPFRFINEYGSEITDAEKVFHKLRLSNGERFYIHIQAGSYMRKMRTYLPVIEDNPHSEVRSSFSIEASKLIDKMIRDAEEKRLRDLIDKALDERKKRNFNKYVKELNEFLKK